MKRLCGTLLTLGLVLAGPARPAQGATAPCLEEVPRVQESGDCEFSLFVPPADGAENKALNAIDGLKVAQIELKAVCGTDKEVAVRMAYLSESEGMCDGMETTVTNAAATRNTQCRFSEDGITLLPSRDEAADGGNRFVAVCRMDWFFGIRAGLAFPPPATGRGLAQGRLLVLQRDGTGRVAETPFPLNVEEVFAGEPQRESLVLDMRVTTGWSMMDSELDAMRLCDVQPLLEAATILPAGCEPADLVRLEWGAEQPASDVGEDEEVSVAVLVQLERAGLPSQCEPLLDLADRVQLSLSLSGCGLWFRTDPIAIVVPLESEPPVFLLVLILIAVIGVIVFLVLSPPRRRGLFVSVGSASETIFRRNDQRVARVPVGALAPQLSGELVFESGPAHSITIAPGPETTLRSPYGDISGPVEVLVLRKSKVGFQRKLTVFLEDGSELIFGMRRR